jgi:hypothetical protein
MTRGAERKKKRKKEKIFYKKCLLCGGQLASGRSSLGLSEAEGPSCHEERKAKSHIYTNNYDDNKSVSNFCGNLTLTLITSHHHHNIST